MKNSKQLSFFPNPHDSRPDDSEKNGAYIPGLMYIPDWLSPSLEQGLMSIVDTAPWQTALKRRVQHYGCRYDYGKRVLIEDDSVAPLPPLFSDLGAHIAKQLDVPVIFQQVIVNEYQPGQGIALHVDAPQAFGPHLAAVSLLSGCIMRFRHVKTGRVVERWLAPRSLLCLSAEARYDWQHGIAARKSDALDGQRRVRARRVSLTFRQVRNKG